jgi:hypothetical protein
MSDKRKGQILLSESTIAFPLAATDRTTDFQGVEMLEAEATADMLLNAK